MNIISEKFKEYKNSKIAVYGLGVETERILPELEKYFQVAGLLDGYREEGDLYGKPIISMALAIKKGVGLILVVARPGSCRAIAKRVSNQCLEYGIRLLDIRGNDLLNQQKVVYDFKGVDGITKSNLLQKINSVDVVSFDLFDTLVMRQVLFSTDIFDLMSSRMKECGILIKDFPKKRLDAEKYLSKSKAPTLVEIYTWLIEAYGVSGISPQKLAELEWEIDYGMLIPRREICELVCQVINEGKKVYIVSDTYYTQSQIRSVLDKCGIFGYQDVLVSCKYQTGKTQGLFERLKERIDGKSSLHIGDDIVTDIESARKSGIEACQVYSGAELLELAGYLGFWDQINGISDRVKVGMFMSRIFNSPFQFETDNKRIGVKSALDVGYLFFAPMISDFVLWLSRQLKQKKIGNVWFCARDGYLIKRLFDEIQEDISSIYFLTSRMAAICAGIENEEDIQYVSEMRFSGSLNEQLKERFDIVANQDKGENLKDYKEEIFEKATVSRENYKAYIKGLGMGEGDIALFDFVAKGTSQMFLSHLVENHLTGFYFLQLEEEYMREKKLDIVPFYKKDEQEDSAVFDNYYIMEIILSSPMPSVKGFTQQGKPIYVKETRKNKDIICLQCVQDGVYEFFKAYLEHCPRMEMVNNKKLDEAFLALVHNIAIIDEAFLELTIEDQFFNRMTKLTDLI